MVSEFYKVYNQWKKQLNESDDEPEESDAFIADAGRRGIEVSVDEQSLGQFKEEDDAEQALAEWMKKNKFWPDVWKVSDHGNYINVSERFYQENTVE